MKKKYPLIIEIIIGIIFIGLGFFVVTEDYYSTLFYALGFGWSFAAFIQLVKIFYYEMPANKNKFENKEKEEYINRVDERKIYLRMKAGSFTYQLMAFVLLFLTFILSILHVQAWVIAIIFGLFLLQTILGVVLYKHFEKNM